MLIVDKHCSDVCCDTFPVPQIDCKSKHIKEQRHAKFYYQSVWGKTVKPATLNTENLWLNNKVRGDKMQFVCIC